MLRDFFFFQAEDGIRDLVRSRGLGDVYKRQAFYYPSALGRTGDAGPTAAPGIPWLQHHRLCPVSVSYTHLTLPTSDLV